MSDHFENVLFQGFGPFALPAAQRAIAIGGSNGVQMTLYCLIVEQQHGTRAVNVQMASAVAQQLSLDLHQAAIDAEAASPDRPSAQLPPRAHAHVELLRLGDDLKTAEAVHLVVHYAGQEALLELPVAAPQSDREQGTERYRHELQRLISALQEAAASPEGITWPYRRD